MSIIIFFLLGALGALVKDILEEGKIRLPKKIDSDLCLGFLGGMVVGGCAGVLIDQNPTMAFVSGYAGTSIIENLILKSQASTGNKREEIKDLIRVVATQEKVSPELAIKVAECESGLNLQAININKDGSRDRGLFQINSKWHPTITDEIAFDPIKSTQFFCKAFKEGHLDWWNATKKCWEK